MTIGWWVSLLIAVAFLAAGCVTAWWPFLVASLLAGLAAAIFIDPYKF